MALFEPQHQRVYKKDRNQDKRKSKVCNGNTGYEKYEEKVLTAFEEYQKTKRKKTKRSKKGEDDSSSSSDSDGK